VANDSVTLFLDGAPTLDDYAHALDALRALLSAITERVAGPISVEWRVDTLEASSALTTLRGEAENMAVVEEAAATYLDVGRKLAQRQEVDAHYQRSTNMLLTVLTARVPSLRIETDLDDVTITLPTDQLADVVQLRPTPQQKAQIGAVEGRIETMSRRRGLRFVLFDSAFDKAVTCYLDPGQEDLMRDAWGRLAIIEGMVKRDPTSGRPTTVRQVTAVHLLDEGERGGWRRARGAQPDAEPSEDRIRRIRDA
jgi:hypothetical protein